MFWSEPMCGNGYSHRNFPEPLSTPTSARWFHSTICGTPWISTSSGDEYEGPSLPLLQTSSPLAAFRATSTPCSSVPKWTMTRSPSTIGEVDAPQLGWLFPNRES